MIELSQFVQWCFYGLMSFCAVSFTSAFKAMQISIDELNIKMATIIEKTSSHEKRIEKLEDKITQ